MSEWGGGAAQTEAGDPDSVRRDGALTEEKCLQKLLAVHRDRQGNLQYPFPNHLYCVFLINVIFNVM